MQPAATVPHISSVINFHKRPGKPPHVDVSRRTITLPAEVAPSDLVPVLGGTCYLFHMPHSDCQYLVGIEGPAVFAVRLSRKYNLRRIAHYPTAEQRFLESLRPKELVKYREQYRAELSRQGEIWLARLVHERTDLGQCLSHWRAGGLRSCAQQKVTDRRLFETQHRFTGTIYTPRCREGCRLYGQPALILEGTITAPGYEPMTLQSPHIAQRTNAYVRSA